MASSLDRRSFLGKGIAAGGCLAACPFLMRTALGEQQAAGPVFDERMSYCCAECTPESCAFLSHDPEVKRKKAEELSQRWGRKIEPEDVHCSRCRVPDDVAYESIRGCKIRQCVLEKGHVSCAHCPELGRDACLLDTRQKERVGRVRAAL